MTAGAAIAAEQAARLLKQQQAELQAQKEWGAPHSRRRSRITKGKNANVTKHDTWMTYIP
jgi:hypothetical protein